MQVRLSVECSEQLAERVQEGGLPLNLERLFTQPEAPAQPPAEKEVDALMHEQQYHMKPISTSLTPPPPKKSQSAENRKLNDEFDDVQSFHESTDIQGAAGGGL